MIGDRVGGGARVPLSVLCSACAALSGILLAGCPGSPGDGQGDSGLQRDAGPIEDASVLPHDALVCPSQECDQLGAMRCDGDVIQRCEVYYWICSAWTEVERCADSGQSCTQVGARSVCRGAHPSLKSKGLWVSTSLSGDEASFLDVVAAHGFSDVFFLVKDAEGVIATDFLEPLVISRDASGYDIRLWAWMHLLENSSYGGWVDPEDEDYRGMLVDDVSRVLHAIPLDGLMLDSIRYPGTAQGRTAPITAVVQEMRWLVDLYNSYHQAEVLLGAVVMPEPGGGNESAYGQDVAELALSLDVVAPMVFRYDYAQPVSWITSVNETILTEVGVASDVWPMLQNRTSHTIPLTISPLALEADIVAALAPCALGFSVFQYPQITEAQWAVLDSFVLGQEVCDASHVPAP